MVPLEKESFSPDRGFFRCEGVCKGGASANKREEVIVIRKIRDNLIEDLQESMYVVGGA
jgi:hypothetical protein